MRRETRFVAPLRRSEWFTKVKAKIKGCNLIFVDPDNGIAAEGLKLTHRRAGKSVTIEEIKALQETKRAMVIYHHQTRFQGGHFSEICDLTSRLCKASLDVCGVLRAKPWSPRAFFILNGDEELHDRAKKISKLWGSRISWHPARELLKNSR